MAKRLALALLLLWGVVCFLDSSVGPTSAASAPAEVSTDRPLTLEECIGIALKNHGSILAALEEVQASRYGIIQARAPLYLQATTGSTYLQTHNVQTTAIGTQRIQTGRFNQISKQYTGTLSMLLFDSGQIRTSLRQAKASAYRAEGGVASARNALIFNVTNDYFALLRSQKLLSLAEEQVKRAEQHLEMVQAQVDAGTAAKIDLYPVQVELANAKLSLLRAQNDARVAGTNLRNSMGLERGPAPQVVDVPETATFALQNLEGYVGEAGRSRPELQEAQASVMISEASLSLARIRARPLVSLTTSASHGFFSSPQRNSWNLRGALSFPLFDAGATRAAVAEAGSGLEQSRIRYAQLQKDVDAEVETAYLNILSAREQIEASRVVVEQARVNLEAANEKYRLGVGIIIEIVDAQVQFFNAQINATEAFYSYQVAKAALDRAVGKTQ